MPDVYVLNAIRIEGRRTRLRPPVDDDIDGLVDTLVDPRVRRFLGGPLSEAHVRGRLHAEGAAAVMSSCGIYVVTSKESDDMLGTVTLTRCDLAQPGHVRDGGNELELGYVFRAHTWGQGYARDAAYALLQCAASELGDQPVVIVTQTTNVAARRLAQRMGFAERGAFTHHGAEHTLLAAPLSGFTPS